MTQINIKRVYETPSSNDGYRVLVDRLSVSYTHLTLPTN